MGNNSRKNETIWIAKSGKAKAEREYGKKKTKKQKTTTFSVELEGKHTQRIIYYKITKRRRCNETNMNLILKVFLSIALMSI